MNTTKICSSLVKYTTFMIGLRRREAKKPYLWGKMSKSPCPITIIRAQYSDVINDEGWKKIQSKVARGHFLQADDAGHLVPFEQPELCANLIDVDIRRISS